MDTNNVSPQNSVKIIKYLGHKKEQYVWLKVLPQPLQYLVTYVFPFVTPGFHIIFTSPSISMWIHYKYSQHIFPPSYWQEARIKNSLLAVCCIPNIA